jgi:stress response protein SCP2
MAINLTKGQTIDLRKETNNLDQITIGLGWKVREKKKSLFGRLFSADDNAEFDLDAIAFLMDGNGKIMDRGDSKLVGGDVVFFNSRQHSSGTVTHGGDNRIGGTGASDDEQIIVKLNSVPSRYHRILFLVCIYQGIKLGQHFGQLQSAYIRAVDGSGSEVARYSLNADAGYADKCTLVFGDVCRRDNEWKFRAIGEAYPYDSFVHLLKDHLA